MIFAYVEKVAFKGLVFSDKNLHDGEKVDLTSLLVRNRAVEVGCLEKGVYINDWRRDDRVWQIEEELFLTAGQNYQVKLWPWHYEVTVVEGF